MNHALLNMTDKVTRMVRSMVCFAMESSYTRGATTEDISGFLSQWAPDGRDIYHAGVVDRALGELARQGRVVRDGALWYPAPHSL